MDEPAKRDAFEHQIQTDRTFRRLVMVLKIRALAALARTPDPDPTHHSARVRYLEEGLCTLTTLACAEPHSAPAAAPGSPRRHP